MELSQYIYADGPTDIEVRRHSIASMVSLQNVSRSIVDCKEKFNDLVIVVVAMGNTTNKLVGKARVISSSITQREMDMLLATHEKMSIGLRLMALHSLGE